MSLICPMRSSCVEIIAATQYSPCVMTLSPYWQLLYSVSPCGSIQPCQVEKWMPLVLRERANIYCMSKSFYPWCVARGDKTGWRGGCKVGPVESNHPLETERHNFNQKHNLLNVCPIIPIILHMKYWLPLFYSPPFCLLISFSTQTEHLFILENIVLQYCIGLNHYKSTDWLLGTHTHNPLSFCFFFFFLSFYQKLLMRSLNYLLVHLLFL